MLVKLVRLPSIFATYVRKSKKIPPAHSLLRRFGA